MYVQLSAFDGLSGLVLEINLALAALKLKLSIRELL